MMTSNKRKAGDAAGQTVLITGASSGIGRETARKLLEEGYTVYAAARRLDRMRDLEDLGATALKMDVTRDEDIVAVVERVKVEQGGTDVLINNAGFGLYGAMEDTPLGEARYQFEVNLFGAARLTQLVLPYMREQHAGKIVNISSIGGKIYTPLGSLVPRDPSMPLKDGRDCLRFELKDFGIDVIVIEPGFIRTEFGSVSLGPMLERSGGTAYSNLANRVLGMRDRIKNDDSLGSPPSLIADTIARSLEARRPKTRYVAGQYARPLIFLRRLLSDRMFDRIIARMAG